METQEQTNQHDSGQIVDIASNIIPDLAKAIVKPINLAAEYWTPDPPSGGEEKRLLFDRFEKRTMRDTKTGEEYSLNCVYFLEPNFKKKTVNTISNGSIKMVTTMERYNFPRGTPLLIKHTGKEKCTNGNSADTWEIYLIELEK